MTFTSGSKSGPVETQAATVADFLRERGISPQPADRLSLAPDAPIADGGAIVYRAAIPLTLVIDGASSSFVTPAATVGEALRAAHVGLRSHDTVVPALGAEPEADGVVRVTHTTSWLERVRTAIAPPLRKTFDVSLSAGNRRVVDAGSAGSKETTVEVMQPDPSTAPKRFAIASRILRFPRARVVAEGVGDYSALAGIARRGMTGTLRLADQALRMVATAYTAACSGCSGMTASGRRAGQGVVAVDPRYIPLGTRLFIPGYGHAYAGDTGGGIHGARIDLGFETSGAALRFGRRQVVVYILK